MGVFDQAIKFDIADIADDLQQCTSELSDNRSLDPLMERIGDARFVLLGEASHGTHEYYLWRTRISQRLIKEKGFSFIAVEGDWPDCYKINRFIKGFGEHADMRKLMKTFNRWPTWMWANWEIVALTEWLQEHNSKLSKNRNKVGFYGLDVYSLWESLEAIIDYLEKTDPETAKLAKKAYTCFEPYIEDEGQSYARATQLVPQSCREEVISLLTQIRKKAEFYNNDPESVFNAEQNAQVAVNAELYYRSMLKNGPSSWNIRDRHMLDTLNRVTEFYGPDSKAIIWEHNTHIGDARATGMFDQGMYSLGQLIREQEAKKNVVLVGFGSYQGSVMASYGWGEPMVEMNVPPAMDNSWEDLLHKLEPENKLIILDNLKRKEPFNFPIEHRAIGVVYDPRNENPGNYVPSIIPERYDAFLFIDETKALHPLSNVKPELKQTPETFPWEE